MIPHDPRTEGATNEVGELDVLLDHDVDQGDGVGPPVGTVPAVAGPLEDTHGEVQGGDEVDEAYAEAGHGHDHDEEAGAEEVYHDGAAGPEALPGADHLLAWATE